MARTRATRRRGDGLGPWPAGWRSVARPTRYGNRHPLGTVRPCDACDGARHTAAEAVELYRAELLARPDLADSLRHSCAQRMLDAGADIRQVQHALGHSSVTITEQYLRRQPPGLRDAMEGRTYT